MKTSTLNQTSMLRQCLHFLYGLIGVGVTIVLISPVIAVSQSPAPVNLGSAGNFAILAATTITSTGGGSIDGNIGVWPGSAFVPGTPPATVNGTIYLNDPVAAQGQADLLAAYNNAAGRTSVDIVTLAGNVGGMTLAPGLYKSTSSLAISSGELTLDGQGQANAVWIFQIASTLTTTSGRKVILSGGAQAANIYWIVGSSATMGTGSDFSGNILAWVSITNNTGAAVDGKLLAHTGAVTFNGQAVTGLNPGSADNGLTPKEFSLSQNYPNPFNPVTTIDYQLPISTSVTLGVFDVQGRQESMLVDKVQGAGHYKIVVDAKNFKSGVYFYRLHAGSFASIKKMVFIK
jgi:hypothetical protein